LGKKLRENWIFLSLLFIALWVPLAHAGRGRLSLALTPLLIIVFTAVGLIGKLFRGEKEVVITSLGLPILFFIIIAVLSCLVASVEVFTSTQEFYKILCFILVYFLVINYLRGYSQAETLVLIILSAAFIVSAYGIFQYFRVYQPLSPPRITSTFPPNPNSLAGYVALICPVALGLSLSSNKWWLLSLIGFAVMYLALLFTYSRGGGISFIVGMVLFYIFTRRIKKIILSKAFSFQRFPYPPILIVILIAVITILFLGLNFPVRNTLLVREGGAVTASQQGISQQRIPDTFITDRLKIWDGALKIIREAPLLGVGAGNFDLAFQRYKFPRENVFPARYYLSANFAHNEFLQLGAEMGIIGLGLVLVMLIIFFRKGIQGFSSGYGKDSLVSENSLGRRGSIVSKTSWGLYTLPPFLRAGILSGLAGIMVHSMVDFPLRPPATAITVVFLIALIMGTENPPVKLRISHFPANYRWKWLTAMAVIVLLFGLGWNITIPSWATIYRDRGYAWAEKGNREMAIADYLKAIRLVPRNPVYHYELGVIYRREVATTGKEDLWLSARRELEKAVRLSPREAVYHYHLGRIYWEEFLRGESELLSKAVTELERAIAVNPTFVFAYNTLGMIYAGQGDYRQAEEYFQKALEWEPYYAEARYHLGKIYFGQGYWEKAAREWEMVLEIGKKSRQSILKSGYQKGLIDFDYSLAFARLKEYYQWNKKEEEVLPGREHY